MLFGARKFLSPETGPRPSESLAKFIITAFGPCDLIFPDQVHNSLVWRDKGSVAMRSATMDVPAARQPLEPRWRPITA
ncbi:hypothetical protein BMIN_1597 [Bifidobacterium minimum]|uniref:Uncharacterized protein n=1 Tax=Bifidobacterium minimum TaxID=1693 RepID=A0A087BM10_9BIFI|nr:hypothetical protein BMIN_1597 [Bifidobacterium minimum]